jgi:hypothetical protein
LTFTASSDDTDVSLLVATDLTYRHTYLADGDALFLPSPAAGAVRIGGFTTANVRLLDVTNPNAVTEIPARVVPEPTGFALVAARALPPGRLLYAFADTQILAPVSVVANHPSNWHSAGAQAELVLITQDALLQDVAPLAALRRSQGWTVTTVNVQDLFDEYNCGEKNPGAIQAFLEQSHQASTPAARYALLVGDASFDPRNYLGLGDNDHVMTKLLNTSTIQTASDDWFGDFNGDGVPDIGIGRIPAATAAQADAVVTKLLTYPTTFGGAVTTGGAPTLGDASTPDAAAAAPWPSVGLFVAGDNDGFDFESEARNAEMALPSGMVPQEFFRSTEDPATAEASLIAQLNAGAGLVNYVGHGSVQLWDGLLQTTDIPSLTNGSQLPVYVNMTCLNALFQDPRIESLGTALLLASNGGAVAVWGSSTSPDATVESTVNQTFVQSLSQGALGDAVIQAKSAVTDPDVRIGEVLLGDPSLFGVPNHPAAKVAAVRATSDRLDVGSLAAPGTAAATGRVGSSSCSINPRASGTAGLSIVSLAAIGALFGRRRSGAASKSSPPPTAKRT